MTVVEEIPIDSSSVADRPLRGVFDASTLPSVVFGTRVVTWWGTVGFMITEAATLAACVASYYYIRRNYTTWPPLRTSPPDLFLPTISLVVLLLVIVPNYLFGRAAKKMDRAGTRRWLWVAVITMFVALGLRFAEFNSLNVRWDANAYASVTWMVVFAHFTLLLVDAVETLVFAIMVQRGAAPSRHYPGVAEDAMYSYFMVLVWIPCYVTVYLVPRWV
jgi:heme/copper-type cytochrome/quinol oxidase subunit 3